MAGHRRPETLDNAARIMLEQLKHDGREACSTAGTTTGSPTPLSVIACPTSPHWGHAKLFISTKTAGHHVAAALAETDARTHEIAASRAAPLGLAGTAGI